MIRWLFIGGVAAILAGGVAIGTRHVRTHVMMMGVGQILIFSGVIASWTTDQSVAQRNHISVGMAGLALLLLQTLTGSFFSLNPTIGRLHRIAAAIILCIVVHQTASGLFMIKESEGARHGMLGMLELTEICGAVWLAMRTHQRARIQPYIEVGARKWINWPVVSSITIAFSCAAVAGHATISIAHSQWYTATLFLFYAAEIVWLFLPLRVCIPGGADLEFPILLIAAFAWTSTFTETIHLYHHGGLPTWCVYLHVPMLVNVWLVDVAVYTALP
jgi:hypothetical protein